MDQCLGPGIQTAPSSTVALSATPAETAMTSQPITARLHSRIGISARRLRRSGAVLPELKQKVGRPSFLAVGACRAPCSRSPLKARHVRMGNAAPQRQRCDATNITGPKPLRDRNHQHNATPSVGRVDLDTRTEPGTVKRPEDAPCPTNGGDRA